MSVDNELFRGRFDNIPNRRPTAVRIFISSTFTDTIDERDGLMKNVYPKLQDYCLQTYNIQFQYSDMRWGIQDHAIYDHSTVDLCLQELDQCCRLSLATNCVVLLSQKYGWRSLPTRIRSDMLNRFKEILTGDDTSINLIDQAYVLDENFYESTYVLRPIDYEKREEWSNIEKDLARILRRVSDVCLKDHTITPTERNEFHISVTAKEILRALQNNTTDPRRMVSFFREIEDLHQFDITSKSKFIDTDDETELLLNEIKSTIREKLPLENQYNYRVNWNNVQSRSEYLTKFQNDFYNILKQQIDYYMKQVRKKDVLYDEILEHAIQCRILNERYFPRNEILEKVKEFVLSDASQPCIIFGKSGSGKSSIMAQIAVKVLEWYPNPNSVSIIIRFLGVTPLSSDIRRPLISIIQQICILYHLETLSPIENSTTIEELKEILQNLLIQIPSNEHVILLFDSIDQLQVEDYNCEKWLPTNYPSNIKCILSTIPVIVEGHGEQKIEYHILDGLKSLFANSRIIEINEFDRDLAHQVFYSWLERDRRRLSSTQMTWLQPKLEPYNSNRGDAEPTPLFLSLIYQITQTWYSFNDKPDRDFLRIQTTRDAINYLYNQLSKKHGEILFKRAMTYLRLSGGLSESELEDILSADNTILQSIFVHYIPPRNLFRLPSTLWIRIRNDMNKYLIEREVDNTLIIYFYHRSFQQHSVLKINQEKAVETIRRAYFAEPIGDLPDLDNQPFVIQSKKLIEKMNGMTSLVVDRCLTKQQPYILNRNEEKLISNMRRLNQLCLNLDNYRPEPYFLYDYEFMWSLIHCYKMSDRLPAESPFQGIRFLLAQYKSCSNILDQYPDNFAFEILSRLQPFIDILPQFIYNLYEQCLKHSMLCLLKNHSRVLTTIIDRYQLGVIKDISTEYSTLYVILPEKLVILRYYPREWNGKIFEYKLPTNQFSSVKFSPTDIYFYSSESILVFQKFDRRFSFHLNLKEIIHVDFIYNEGLFVCSNDHPSIAIWNLFDKQLVEQYIFDTRIRECSTVKQHLNAAIRVTLINGLTYYFITKNNQNKIQFQLLATLNRKPEQYSIFLNLHTDVYYSENRSYIYLYHFQRSENERLEKIDGLPLVNRVVYRQRFFTDREQSSLIWLTNDSIVIFHTCGKYFLIPGQYHHIYKRCQSKRNFLCCLNKTQSIIDIYEWKIQQGLHTYRLMVHMQIDEKVSRCMCQIDLEWGFIVCCTLENGELRRYRATMLTYLTDQINISSKKLIPEMTIDSFEIQKHFVIVLDRTKCILNLLTFDNNQVSFTMQLRLSSAVSQVVTTLFYLLVVNCDNALSIYSINSTPELFYQTNQFQSHSIKVYSLDSSFIIIDKQTSQLYQIDTSQSFKINKVADLKFSCYFLLSTILADQMKIFILADDHSMLAIWSVQKKTIKYIPVSLSKNIEIIEICAQPSTLIFYDTHRRAYLWNIENQVITHTVGQHRCETNIYCLALNKSIGNKWFLYNTDISRLCNRIRVESFCSIFCFTDDGKYLFGISQKESLLLMYRVEDSQLLEKLFIENLLPHIQISKDCLILSSNNELLLLCITERNLSTLTRNSSGPMQHCSLFENGDWLDCHKDKCWDNDKFSLS